MADQSTTHKGLEIEMLFPNVAALEIYGEWGLGEYLRFLEDLKMRESGFTYEQMGYMERKEASRPHLILESDMVLSPGDWNIRDQAGTPEGSIALLKLEGVMRSQSGLCTEGVDSLIRDLRSTYNNKNIAGVILETDSGGGESGAGTKLKSALGERNKPVVTFAHLAASAAYRAASGTDEIIASSESAEFGSIGTMISLNKFMLAYYKDNQLDFYGKTAPKKNHEFRQAGEDKFDALQKLVDDKTESFQADIRKSRALRGDEAKITETLNGSVFEAQDAKRRGLVDMIGNMNTAIKRVKALRAKY